MTAHDRHPSTPQESERRDADTTAYVRVRVVGDPKGGVPVWIRRAWLGVEFDALPASRPMLVGWSWWKRRKVSRGWIVPAADAVEALRAAGQAEAVAWWEQSGFLADDLQLLVFAQDSCERATP